MLIQLVALVSAFALPIVASTGTVANGTTLPFQRHLVRLAAPGQEPTLAFALQKQGADHDGLTLYTSIDGGTTWDRDLAIQPIYGIRDTADLLPDEDGRGFFLLYSLEPESSLFHEDARSSVVLLHLALVRPGNFRVDGGPNVIFRPGKGEAWFRASLTRDAAGVVHIAATHLALGVFTFRTVTLLNGKLGTPETLLSSGKVFGGGRLLAVGDRVLAIYDDYAAGHPGRYRLRAAGAHGVWGPERIAAPDGLYHAGAFSVTSTPDGHAHLAYSDKGSQALRYREFDGRAWSARVTVEPLGHWANQIAIGRQAGTIVFAWNHFEPATGRMGIRVRQRIGNGFGPLITVAPPTTFKGYTTALEAVRPGEPWIVSFCEQRALGVPPAEAVAAPLYLRGAGLVAPPRVLHPPRTPPAPR